MFSSSPPGAAQASTAAWMTLARIGVAGPDRLQALLLEHGQRLAQPVEVGDRRRAAVAQVVRTVLGAGGPVPVPGAQAGRPCAASARGPAHTKPRPGGTIRPFCEPATVRSTPHASISYSSQAIEAMQSTMSSAGWSAASIARRFAAMSLRTEVPVSTCATNTAVIPASCRPAAARPPRRRRRPPLGRLQHLDLHAGEGRRLAPRDREPAGLEHEHRSPRDSVLLIAISHPPCPFEIVTKPCRWCGRCRRRSNTRRRCRPARPRRCSAWPGAWPRGPGRGRRTDRGSRRARGRR